MKKEDILEKYKNSEPDELVIHAQNKGAVTSYAVMGAGTLIILILCQLFNQEAAFRAVSTLLWIQAATFGFVQYRFTKMKKSLFLSVVSSISAVGYFINFLIIIWGQ